MTTPVHHVRVAIAGFQGIADEARAAASDALWAFTPWQLRAIAGPLKVLRLSPEAAIGYSDCEGWQ